MLILSKLCPTNDFFILLTKKMLLWRKKWFFQSDLKIMFFFFEMLMLSELWPIYYFFILITKYGPLSRNVDIKQVMTHIHSHSHSHHKNRPFHWNVDIFGHMEYSELGRHSKTLTCCSRAWKYKGWETLS